MGRSRRNIEPLANCDLCLHLPPKRKFSSWLTMEVTKPYQMFSILNELKDNSPGSVIGVVGSSIGSAASIYVVVSICGYLTFGNDISGNIISMCTFEICHLAS